MGCQDLLVQPYVGAARWCLLLLLLAAAAPPNVANARVPGGERVTPRMLLVGGREVREETRYPYMTRIHFVLDDAKGLMANCGGTLLSRRLVLTAAHCVALAQRSGANVFLRVGAYNPWVDEALQHTYELRRAIRFVSHPGFVQLAANRPTSPNDIALVLLDRPVSRQIPAVRLANATTAYPAQATELYAVGWGTTDSANSQPSFDLRELALPAVSRKLCSQLWTYAWASPDMIQYGHICAGLQSQRNICFGDSGGPLLLRGGSAASDVQLGITSFSFPTCASPGMPGVFTFIPPFRQWIDEQVDKLDPRPPAPAPVRLTSGSRQQAAAPPPGTQSLPQQQQALDSRAGAGAAAAEGKQTAAVVEEQPMAVGREPSAAAAAAAEGEQPVATEAEQTQPAAAQVAVASPEPEEVASPAAQLLEPTVTNER